MTLTAACSATATSTVPFVCVVQRIMLLSMTATDARGMSCLDLLGWRRACAPCCSAVDRRPGDPLRGGRVTRCHFWCRAFVAGWGGDWSGVLVLGARLRLPIGCVSWLRKRLEIGGAGGLLYTTTSSGHGLSSAA